MKLIRHFARKTLKLLIGLTALALIGRLCFSLFIPYPEDRSHVFYIPIQTVEDLEATSDAVLLVTVTGERRQEEYQEGRDLTTITNVRVEQVFQGDLQPGDNIPVVEPFGFLRSQGKLVFRSSGDYMPLMPQDHYILFLRKTSSGSYASGVLGKYVLPRPRELTAVTLEVYQLPPKYLLLYQQVWEKYSPALREKGFLGIEN